MDAPGLDPHLLVELDIGEYGVDAPGLGEHGPSNLVESDGGEYGVVRARSWRRWTLTFLFSWTLMNIEWTRMVWTLTFLLSWTLVNMEWMRQVLENMDPHLLLSWTVVNMEWTRQVLENMDSHLLVELDIGEYGVDAPGLGEHGLSPSC